MRRLLRVLAGALFVAGCAGGVAPAGGPDAGPACVDLDHDGFGQNCALGRDCNDHNPASTNECRTCAHPDVGCPCATGQQPISCFGQDQALGDGNVMCHEGTRFCRDNVWTACTDIHGYEVTPDRSLTSLVNNDAAPENCSICQIDCFKVHDPLLADGGATTGLSYSSGGGLTITTADGGSGTGGDGGMGSGTYTGCMGLTACCSTLGSNNTAQTSCNGIATAGNVADCNSALQVYCPSSIGGPIAGCSVGSNSADTDCDGIPDVLDECTAATVATNPACQGTTLPLSTTNNQTIFHILDKGQTGSNSLEIGFKVQNADVYFLLDTSDTMNQERDQLVSSLTGCPVGQQTCASPNVNVVECALLKNCCDRQPDMTKKTACNNVVTGDNVVNCKNAEATYCTGSLATIPHCPDLNFDGLPDDQLKNQGVVGAVRCLVGSAWFGTGYFREIPSAASTKIGDLDEHAFRHYVDMTPDVSKVRDAISLFQTNGNSDYPEDDVVALYSLMTGKGAMFGNTSPSIPERLGLGCPANTFGYPCFRKGTIPIVVLFTDDPLHNGPTGTGTYGGGGIANVLPYAGTYSPNGKASTSGVARYTPVQAETFAQPFNLGSMNKQFVIADGNLQYMTGDYPSAVTGCGAATTAPDAVYVFKVDPLLNALGIPIGTPVTVPIAINTTIDGNSLQGAGPTPATDAPVVVSLYRGVPAGIPNGRTHLTDTRIYAIPSGPDLSYLMYDGTTAGKASATGFLGGISGCGADGKTNEAAFTFTPMVNAKIVIDSSGTDPSAGGFHSVISLHKGAPSTLPANPSGSNLVPLIGAAGNNNDTFTTARRVDGADNKIDGDYVTYTGDMVSLGDTGSGSNYNVPSGKMGKDDYDDTVVSCGVNQTGVDAVYKFTVGTPRRVHIDTEGSNFQTVISLHDAPPPQSFVETGITGNGSAPTAHAVGAMSGNSVTNTLYSERSDSNGTNSLADKVAPVCGGVSTTNSKDAFYTFSLTQPTHVNLKAPARRYIAVAGQAYNTPGATNESVSTSAPPGAPHAEPVINEFLLSDTTGESHEFIEVYGQPNTNYAAYAILQIDGNSGSTQGVVVRQIVVGTTDASGLWVTNSNNALQNSSSTLLLVKNYTGSASTDVDTDDDGTVDDPAPWTSIADSVAISDGGGSDKVYGGAVVLAKNFDGGSMTVQGASRIPSGKDTDKAADWVRNDYAGDGLPGFGFDPMVFLYSSPPGTVTTINAGDPNGDGNASDSNTHNNAVSALNIGDVFGQVDTKITNADLSDPHTTNDYPRGIVTCNGYAISIGAISTNTLTISTISGYTPAVGDLIIKGGSAKITTVSSATSVIVDDGTKVSTGPAMLYPGLEPPGRKDHVYKFTPSVDGTVRINTATTGAEYQAVAIYDGPPPINGSLGSVQVFDTSKLTPPPEPGCTAYSYDANKADGTPAHLYWFCANARNWATAESNCNVIGGHLARIDNGPENTFVGGARTGTPAWIGAKDTGTNVWTWSDNGDQFWTGGKTGSAVGGRFASWVSGQPATSGQCVGYTKTGSDNTNWSGSACTNTAQYACEISSPPVTAPESLATAYAVGQEVGLGGNMAGKVLTYNGSTKHMDSDVTLSNQMTSACGASAGAADAVFKIVPASSILITIDTSGSAFPAVVGLFHTTIDSGGFVACDAPGVAPGTDVSNSGTPVSTLPLGGTAGVSLTAGDTYYAVIKGTTASPDGAYTIKFTDLGAGGNGLQLACSKQTASGPTSAEADFSANHTYYVIVEAVGPTGAPYDMTAHSLYTKRVQVENPLDQNEHGGTALSVADPYRSKIQVVNTSTAGMAANYTTVGDTMGGQLSCGASSAAPDAVYKFTPSIDTSVRVRADMGAKSSVVALFKGQPGSFPTITNLGPGNTNENTQTAYPLNVSGPAQTVLGDTSLMTNDIDGTLLSCGASPTGRDAVFKFSLSKQTQMQIDASASTAAGKMGDPVIALFHDYALEKPVAVTLENDSYTDADLHPSPTAIASNNWLAYKADMANLTPATQAQLSVAATNMNEQVNPATLQGAQDLGDIFNTKVTVGGATTASMAADYPVLSCGGDAAAPDAVYSFHVSQPGPVHISTAKPAPGFNTVLALYDGSTGVPLRKVDSGTTTVDLNSSVNCGNGTVNWDEQCDDAADVTGGAGCFHCVVTPNVWRCNPTYIADGFVCDKGCGQVDPDCSDASVTITACGDVGSCNPGGCPGRIDPSNTGSCRAAVCGDGIVEAGEQCDDGNANPSDGCDTCVWKPGVWHCPASAYGTGNGCDCGCGLPDPDCGGNMNASACVNCNAIGGCNVGACPGGVTSTNNATCTSFGGGSNSNDTLASATDVNLAAGGVRRYLGNTSLLSQDVPSTQTMCGATTTAPDAIYQFSLRKTTQVQIDATNSSNKPVIALFNAAALGTAPSTLPLENDEAVQADSNPSPTPQLKGNWVSYSGDIADLTNSVQPQTAINNQDNSNNDTQTELLDPVNRRVTVTNADTSAMSAAATYPAPSCGGVATAKDALYRFVPSVSGQVVRISTNYPATKFSSLVALYDGSNGAPPLTRAQSVTTTAAIDNSYESQATARPVPLEAGGTYVDTGVTTGMASDVPYTYFQQGGSSCNASSGSADAVFTFALSKPTDVEINAQGSAFGTVLGLFDSPISRPSVMQQSSLVDSVTQLYDPDRLPAEPEAGCSPFDFNLHRYWFCTTKRPWDDARAKCQLAGYDLVTIDNQLEQDTLFGQVSSTGEAHLIGLHAHVPYTSWGPSPFGDWDDGSTSTYRNWLSGEPNQPSDSPAARMRSQDGAWLDTPESWQSYRYICEQNAQPTLPSAPIATNPQVVDIFGSSRHFVGSTVGTANSVGNLIGCSAQAAAPDAAFRIDLGYITTVSVTFTGSFAGSVVGLFKDAIGSTGYSAAGSLCAAVGAGAPQLQLNNLAPGTYYVVLTGTASGVAGKYDISFSGSTTDPAAFVMENDRLADAVSNPIGNIGNRWVVKTADMSHLHTDLITTRTVDMPGSDSNDSHVTPYQVKDLGSTSGEQVTVTNAGIGGLGHDYTAPTCGVSDDTADAIYKFSPTKSTPVRISVAPSGWNSVVALYRGPDFPLLRSQTAPPPVALPNTNDVPATSGANQAKDLGTIFDPIIYTGDVSALANATPDVPTVDSAGRTWDRSDLNGGDAANMCNASPSGKDAFFRFTIAGAEVGKSKVFQTSQTAFAHTLALWHSTDVMTAPAAVTAENNTRAAASNLPIDNQWYVLQGNTTNLTPGGDAVVVKTAPADFTNSAAVQNLGTLAANTQILTSGADSSAGSVAATYDTATLTCGAAPSAHDMIFKFHTNATGGATRISVNNPSPAFPPVLALFDGSGGKVPQTAAAGTPSPTGVSGNDSRTNAYAVPNLTSTAVAYSGDTTSLTDSQAASLYNQAGSYGTATCNAGATTKDAFFKLHLPVAARIRVQAQASTAIAHTIAIYDANVPIVQPVATVLQYNTYALAAAAPAVTIDANWVHYSADMSPAAGMGIGELGTERFLAAGTDFQNATGVQDIYTVPGTISGKQFRTKAAASYAGGADTTYTGATYPAACSGGNDNANDMIWKVRPTTNTKLRIGVDNPAPSFSPMLMVYDGAPLTSAETGSSTVDLNSLGNTNELFSNARAVTVGSRTTLLGNEGAMGSQYASTQFQSFVLNSAPKCSPAQPGADAFLQLNVRTVPDAVQSYAQIWLDAADAAAFTPTTGAVTTWNDESTKAHNASQGTAANRPSRQLVSGAYAVEFNPTGDTSNADDATEDYLDYAYTSTQDSAVSVFAVWKLISTNFLTAAAIVRSDVGGNMGFGIRMSADGSTNSSTLIYRDSSNVDVAMTGAFNGASGPMLSEVTHDASGAITTYLNGSSFASGAGRVGGTQYHDILVGANNNHTRGLPMDLYELIVVSRAVTATERQTIEGYLAAKWGLQGSLPAAHPYKASAPTRSVQVDSGSTTYGHTLAYFSAVPMTQPATVASVAYDTSDLALQAGNTWGPVNSTWYVRSANAAGLHISELTQTAGTAAADGATQSLGTINGKEIAVTGGSATTAGYAGDYPAACGSSTSAPDAIYSLTASSTTQAHIALRYPNFTGDVALYEAPASAPTAVPWTNGVLGLAAAESNITATNETIAMSQSVTLPTTPSGGAYTGYAAGFTGNPASSNVAGTAFQDPTDLSSCNPDTSSSGEDAFFSFTVPNGPQRQIEISASGTGGDHVLALFDRDPGAPAKPAVTIGSFASNVDTTTGGFFTGAGAWTCSTSGGTTAVYSGSDANGTGASITGTSCGTNTFAIMSQSSGPKAMVVKVSSLTVSNGHTITVRGFLPVIFAVNGSATLGGGSGTSTITADSQGNGGTVLGAGGSYASCGTSAGNAGVADATADKGNGGGSGAGFRTSGPAGGAGNNSGGAGGVASAADTSAAAASLKPLRGGCKGGDGAGTASTGGAGGGAFQISAAGTITLNSGIALSAAGGAGQKANNQEDGGGGGGSGGAILLESSALVQNVTFAAVSFTTGGGGASGNQTDATNGNSGQDGQRSTAQATGGASSNGSGAGGLGGASVGTATAGGAGAGYTPTGSYSKAITIDGAQVASTLANFPVLIKLSSDADIKAHAAASGGDIYFVDSDNSTALDFQRESYDSTTGTLVAWVRIPSLTAATDRTIYVRYGDGGTHNDNKTAVWDSSYFGVWHLDTGDFTDSTTNARNGTNHNTSGGTGQIGTSAVFSDGDYITTGVNLGSTDYTFSVWINMSTSGLSNSAPMEPIDAAPNQDYPPGPEMVVGSGGNLGYYTGSGTTYSFGSAALTSNTWTHVVERVHSASSGGYVEFSVNGGAFSHISANTSGEATAGPLYFGRWSKACDGSFFGVPYPSCLVGTLDEIHISTSIRADAWGQTEYKNQKSGSTFIKTIGSEVAPAAKNGAGGGGGGGGQGYKISSVISSPIWQADTSAATLMGSSPGTFAADDSTWTVKVADLTTMTADWAAASTLTESSYAGTGETADAPLTLPTPTGAKLTIDGNNGARTTSDYDANVCGVDGGKDTVYKFTPTTTGKLRIKVSGRTGTPISNPIVAVYDRYFGNGYFHGCSLQACVTDNNSDTSLPGVQGKSDTDATAGTTTITDLAVTAGTAYYVVVKSGGAIVNGAYNLELTWKDPEDWAGCSEDTYDGKDIWFAFTTAATLASGGSYTIETENSSADTTIALYKDTNGDNTYQSSEYQSCANEVNGEASITATLSPNTKYYVRVKQPVGGSSSGSVVLGVRNSNVVQNTDPSAIACADSGSSLGYAKLVETLDPGTYYVGWKGGRGSSHYTGSYHISLRDNTNLPTPATQIGCSVAASGGVAAIDATLQSGRNYYVLVKGDGASSNSGTYGLDVSDTGAVPPMACNGTSASPGAPDAYEGFSVSGSNKDVTVDLAGSTLNGVYELWKDNGASDTKIGCGVTSGGTTNVTQQLAPGNYYVKVRGTSSTGNAGEQPFQMSVRDDDVQRAADCSDGAATTGTTLNESLVAGTYYVGLKPQAGQTAGSYQLTVRDPAFNTTGGTNVACTTSRTTDVSVTANHDYYVIVKGTTPTDMGTYGLTLTDIGALDTTASSYDTRTDIACGADLAAPDAYYEFTVAAAPRHVRIALTNAFNGAFQLYRDDGSFDAADAISTCSTGSQDYTLTTAGRYFVVVKGRSVASGAAEQPLTLSIRDLDSAGSIACADGTTATPAALQSSAFPSSVLNGSGQLKAGDYYVAITGDTGNGTYALQFNDLDQGAGVSAPVIECTSSMAMTHTLAANTDYYAIVKGDGPPNQGPFTLAVTDVSGVQAIDSTCPTDLAAPDGYAAFTLSSGPRNVRIDMSASSLTGAFQVFDNSGAAVSGCGCSSIATPETCSLAAGTYYIVYRGNNLAAGFAQKPFKITLQDLSALGSMACADGPAGTGATLTTGALAAGTYYLGLIPSTSNASTNYAYHLSVKDAASVAVTSGPEIACAATQIDTNVNAGETYYVVVKGKNVGDEGNYGMTLQDLSGVPSFGCGDDTTSGDGFYSFTVTNPAGSNVTIDSEGSTLQTVLALFPSTANFGADLRNNTTQVCCTPTNPANPTGACNAVATCDGKPDDLIACDSNHGVGGTSLMSGVHLAPGTYYVVVRARVGAPSKTLPFVVSVRDDDGLPSNYCSATTNVATGQARIRQVLQPGTYWAALKGSSTVSPTNGAYSVSFRDYAPFAKAATEIACDTASDTINQTVTAGKPYYVVVKGDTAAAAGQYKLTVENSQAAVTMGCNADPQSPDGFYRFSLNATTPVTIDTSGSTLDTVIGLYNVGVSYFGTNYATDSSGASINCDDDGGQAAGGTAGSSRISKTLAAGDYYVAIRGKTGTGASWGSSSKPYKISIRDTAASANIACAPASSPTLTQTLPAGDYKLVVSDDGPGGSYDVRFKDLSAVSSAATEVACDNINDTIDYTIPANKTNVPYYVVVKGHGAPTAKGAYTLTAQSADGGAATMGCGADPLAADAFFKFNVTQQTDVSIDTVGSALDTVLAIYPGNATVFGNNYAKDAFNQPIGCDNDSGGGTASKISATLAVGTYYAVVKGSTATWGQSNLPFNLSIRDDGSTRAITCANAGGGAKITQTLDAGDYIAVLSDTDPIGSGASGGAYSITFKDLVASSTENGTQIGCALGTLDNGGAGVPVTGGQDYYVIVKGNTASDYGNYSLTVDDMVSSQAAAGSTAIACAGVSSSIDATYPAGNYYAVVTGATNSNGPYELQVKDVDPFLDYNRIACDADSGPDATSVIEADLKAGTHYVVVKGAGPSQTGSYQLNVRDVTANPDNRIACADVSGNDRIEADVKAGQDYTVLLKGDAKGEQGAYNISFYDELSQQSGGGQLLSCQTICPNMPPYNSCRPIGDVCPGGNGQCCSGKCTGSGSSAKCSGTNPAGSQACRSTEFANSFSPTLAADTYYMTVKGRRATEKGFYELQVGDSANGTTAKYVPPLWGDMTAAVTSTGVKVLPVLSCNAGSNSGRCDGAETQLKSLALTSGAIDKSTGQGLVRHIKPDGTGIGSGLTMAVRDLANYLAMDITLSVVNNPGFAITIQKCQDASKPGQSVCTSFSQNCNDLGDPPANTILGCTPGATPKFYVTFTNPVDPNAVPPNKNDPNGGYHFKLQIVGNHQYLLDEVPVYIIPTAMTGPPPPSIGAGTYMANGSYEQQVYGAGCNYYQTEGEAATANSCADKMDNNGDGKQDLGVDNNGDGDVNDPGDIPADPGCLPGSCSDGIDNDGDGRADVKDNDCVANQTQDWTDLFFKADVPVGTSVNFDMCTANTSGDPTNSDDISHCTYSRVATITSTATPCAQNADCKNQHVGSTTRDGFCGTGGQCQFIDPPKVSGTCSTDAECQNGSFNGETIASYCKTTGNQCEFTTPPADIGSNLMKGQNGKPFVKVKITLNANTDRSKTPTVFDWYLQYVCRGNL